jgi:serine/threonine-protein phosphatase 2A regulatory subunit A
MTTLFAIGVSILFERLLFSLFSICSPIIALSKKQVLATVVGPQVIAETMLPLVLRMASDPVPNIRFNVAKTLQTMAQIVGPEIAEARIRSVLNKLAEDTDHDVKYFANQALLSLSN